MNLITLYNINKSIFDFDTEQGETSNRKGFVD